MKGGSYANALSVTRSAYRTYNAENYSNPVLGFRCAKTQ